MLVWLGYLVKEEEELPLPPKDNRMRTVQTRVHIGLSCQYEQYVLYAVPVVLKVLYLNCEEFGGGGDDIETEETKTGNRFEKNVWKSGKLEFSCQVL